MERAPDIEGVFQLSSTEGRNTPVKTGYRPAHKLHENYSTSGVHQYLDVAEVAPGEAARVAVWFITPEVYPRSLWKGREITVHEGERTVGILKITRVINPNLRGKAATYDSEWVAPPD